MAGSKSNVSKTVRRSLLIKLISKAVPTREELDSIIDLTANKVIDDLHAQSITLYLIEGNQIAFKYVYYSPTLWGEDAELKAKFKEKRDKLLSMKIPFGTGLVGKVIQTGESNIFKIGSGNNELYNISKATDFAVTSMLTVPLKDQKVIGAIQVLNKEPTANPPYLDEKDLVYLQEIAEYTSALLLRILDPTYQISDSDTARFIASFTEMPLITDVDAVQVDKEIVDAVDSAIVRSTGIFPYKKLENTDNDIAVLMKNPLDYQSREIFGLKTKFMIDEVSVVSSTTFNQYYQKYYAGGGEGEGGGDFFEDMQQMHSITSQIKEEFGDIEKASDIKLEALQSENEASAPIVKLVNQIIEDAYTGGASDLHIEPQENRLLVRYRVDGVCSEKLSLPLKASTAIVARIKIMCNLDIAQTRLPQDGRIDFSKFSAKKLNIDLRVATCPSLFGEKIVMRILDKQKSALPITALGFSDYNLKMYRHCIRQPYGMLLHCGPTGSGKSMTLFSALKEIANPEINIQTAEDPIEYTLKGVNQLQTHKSIGLTFAAALRSFLRMDPDVILVGEIRDQETAEIAVEAALTGHLLLSTIHTNDAPSSVARFVDMGIEPFMFSSSLLVVCAQRLIRRICTKCREKHMPDDEEKKLLENAIQWSGEIYAPAEKGCPYCGGIGMHGRIGIHELMRNSEELTAGINRGDDTAKLKEIAIRNGMRTLHQDAMYKVQEGITTVLEAVSVAPPDIR